MPVLASDHLVYFFMAGQGEKGSVTCAEESLAEEARGNGLYTLPGGAFTGHRVWASMV